ncbi:MAG: prolyl oligopeptidase family serine peptidase, partial [Rikenellaceae bacterium]
MNKITMAFIFSSLAALLSSCGLQKNTVAAWEKPQMSADEIAKGEFTPSVMLKMGRLSEPQLSPDGTQILYGVTYLNIEENSSRTNLYIQSTQEGAEAEMVTTGDFKDYNNRWGNDGKTIYFLSNRSKDAQLWSMDVSSKTMKQLSKVESGINGFEIAPNGDKIWYTQQIKVDQTAKDIYPDMQKANVMVYDDLMVRHWNYWLDGTYSHLMVATLGTDSLSAAKDIMQDEPWDAPLAPYFDISEVKWNNAGSQLAYTSKKLKGSDYAFSTNSEIYLYDTESGVTKNLTEGMPGYDRTPLFSPDDKQIAWLSMERPGNEADKSRLFVMNLMSGEKSYVTKSFDYNAANLVWSDNNTIYFIAPISATHQICKVEAKDNAEVAVLTEGLHDYISLSLAGGKMIAEKTTLSMAPEIFSINVADGKDNQLTSINKDIYANIKLGEVQKRMIKTTDGKEMLTWVLLPPDFDSTKTYPALLYCEGGPQSVVSQRWSYRWNLQLMASHGYVVVAPNRRGLPSFGQEWLDQISGDYSGQNIK